MISHSRALPASLAIAAFLSAALPLSRAHARAHGYFVDPGQARLDATPSLEKRDGDFTMSIRRDVPDSVSARLLRIAEATYPPRSRLIELAIQNESEIGPDTARAPLWWHEGVGAARIPYAVTRGAIDHYRRLTEEFRRHVYWGTGGIPPLWSELTYRATIKRKWDVTVDGESFARVYVAELMLDWRYDDGTYTSVAQGHRIVVLSPDGTVLSVDGDGVTDQNLSFSSPREVGKEQKRRR